MLEIIGGELTLTFKKDIAIADAFIVELEVVHPVHALDIHGQPFQPVGDLARHRRAIEPPDLLRSEEHTSELQPLMSTSYAVFFLKNKISQTHLYILQHKTQP